VSSPSLKITPLGEMRMAAFPTSDQNGPSTIPSFRDDVVDGLSEEIAALIDRGCERARIQRALADLSFALSPDERITLGLFTSCYRQCA
jgi:hypothetical protein